MSNELKLVPINQRDAKEFVKQHHRHHRPPVGSLFQIACTENGEIVGVVIVGRPIGRMLDDGWTAEITRCCTNGTKNACSMLYGAARRAAWALGYKRLVTYVLDTEKGTSLKAAGYKCIGQCGGGTWNRKERPRIDKHPTQKKFRFEVKQKQ